MGGDVFRKNEAERYIVSIHAPAWGATIPTTANEPEP